MRAWLFLLVIALLISFVVGSFFTDDGGYVLLSWDVYTLETSLWFFGVIIFLATIAGSLALRAILIPIGFDRRFNQWRRHRKSATARRQTTRGLLALAQGQWRRAERHLTRSAVHSDQPLINYLAAARAAYEQGKPEATDQWLKEASKTTRGSELAIGLTQVELLRSRKQFEQALAVLLKLREKNTKHAYVLKLLVRTYQDLEDWKSINDLLPTIRKLTKLPAEELQTLEEKTGLQLLERNRNSHVSTLKRIFSEIPRSTRFSYAVASRYVDILISRDFHKEAEEFIRENASNVWHDDLILIYGELQCGNDSQQLLFAEQQLQERPNDPYLLLTLARLSHRLGTLDKAKEFVQMGLKIKGLPELHAEMASILVDEGSEVEACKHYQLALA